MKRPVLLLNLLLSKQPGFAQKTLYSFTLGNKALLEKQLRKAIPGCNLLDLVTGDITDDNLQDIIVIGSPKTNREKNRTVFLFINEQGTKFSLKAKNTNLVECEVCGGAAVGDPYQQVVVKNGFFTFESLFGACNKTQIKVTFRFDKKRNIWFLRKYTSEDYNCRDTDEKGVKSTFTKDKTGYGKTTFENY